MKNRKMLHLAMFAVLLAGMAFIQPIHAQDANDATDSFREDVFEKTFGTGAERPTSNPFNQNLVGDVRTSLPGELSATRSSNPLVLVNRIVQVLLSFIGIGTIILMVYAGFLWMTSAGNDEMVTKAKRTLRNSLIGLILIMMSYSLTIFVARRIQRETGSYGVGNTFRATTGSTFDALPQGNQEQFKELLK